MLNENEWSWKSLSLEQFCKEKNYPIYWEKFFERDDVKKVISNISETLKERSKLVNIYPSIENVFRVFSLPKEKIKLIILGQDPYHNPNSATGLCFSVPKNSKLNPSLQNIYKELENSGFKPNKSGDLSSWHKQGVFLINTALTVEESSPESHISLWEPFTLLLMEELQKLDCCWLLMGSKAYKYKKYAKNYFATTHPSPLSAYKSTSILPAFIGSKIFGQISEKINIVW